MRRRKRSAMGAALGTDHALTARVIELADQLGRAVGLAEIARRFGIGESKVAISMRYAEEDGGYVRRLRGAANGQDAWEPTEAGLRQFPPDRPHVMPDAPEVELRPGVRISGVDDPRRIGFEEGDIPLTDTARTTRELADEARRHGLGHRELHGTNKPALPPGSDEE